MFFWLLCASSLCTQSEFISEDDVIKIREQATRSLAPVEKDFTSTVVIKNNETLLINESQFNRKRRSTRCQKRYNDDLFYDELNPDKPAVLGLPPQAAVDKEKEEAAKAKAAADLEKNRKVFVYEDTFKKIKDLSIVVPRFDFLDDIVPWCIFHNSYKCNCKNNMNLRSKRSVDKSEESNTEKPGPKRRSQVKNDQAQKKFKEDDDDDIPLKEIALKKDVAAPVTVAESNNKTPPPTITECPEESKKPQTVLAQKSQRYMSRKEPPTSQAFVSVEISDSDMEISENEDEEEQLASSHHKRYIVFNTKKSDHCMRTFGVQKNPYYIGPTIAVTEPPVELMAGEKKVPEDDECMIVEKADEVITIPDDDDDEESSQSNGVELVPQSEPAPSIIQHMGPIVLAPQQLPVTLQQLEPPPLAITQQPPLTIAQQPQTIAHPQLTIAQQPLVIAQQPLTVTQPPPLTVLQPMSTIDQSPLTLLQSALTDDQPTSNQVTPPKLTDGKTSITKMNSLVTKKVMELQKAQSIKVENIVNPGVGKILISTYPNLLSWFMEGKVHIWKIETVTDEDQGYFVLTTYKAMPVLENVIGIMNIRAERNRESLPVIFQLLLAEVSSFILRVDFYSTRRLFQKFIFSPFLFVISICVVSSSEQSFLEMCF